MKCWCSTWQKSWSINPASYASSSPSSRLGAISPATWWPSVYKTVVLTIIFGGICCIFPNNRPSKSTWLDPKSLHGEVVASQQLKQGALHQNIMAQVNGPTPPRKTGSGSQKWSGLTGLLGITAIKPKKPSWIWGGYRLTKPFGDLPGRKVSETLTVKGVEPTATGGSSRWVHNKIPGSGTSPKFERIKKRTWKPGPSFFGVPAVKFSREGIFIPLILGWFAIIQL